MSKKYSKHVTTLKDNCSTWTRSEKNFQYLAESNFSRSTFEDFLDEIDPRKSIKIEDAKCFLYNMDELRMYAYSISAVEDIFKTISNPEPSEWSKFKEYLSKMYAEYLDGLGDKGDNRWENRFKGRYKEIFKGTDVFKEKATDVLKTILDPFSSQKNKDIARNKRLSMVKEIFKKDAIAKESDRRMHKAQESESFVKNISNNNIKNNNKNKKSANYKDLDVLLESKDHNTMKKKADKFSNSYYRDAVLGLDDEAAKSYLTGLKGMYGKKPKKTKADYKKLYELLDETGSDLIGSAHPKTVDIAESMGNGGIFENQIEQQRHNIGVAQSMPSGNFQGKHAWVIHNLVKLAKQADKQGDIEASILIQNALEELEKFNVLTK